MSRHQQETRRPGSLLFFLANQALGLSALRGWGLGTGYSPSFPFSWMSSQAHGPRLLPAGTRDPHGMAILQGHWDLSRVFHSQFPERTESHLVPCRAGPAHHPRPSGCAFRQRGLSPCQSQRGEGWSQRNAFLPLHLWFGTSRAMLLGRCLRSSIFMTCGPTFSLLRINMKPFSRMKQFFPPCLSYKVKNGH